MSLLLLLAVSLLGQGFAWAATPVIVGVGSSRTLRPPARADVRIGSSRVLKVVDLGDRLELIGKKPGDTQIHAGLSAYDVHVLRPADAHLAKHLKSWLDTRKGLHMEINNGIIRITGHLYRLRDWEDLAHIASADGATYVFQAKPLSDVAKAALDLFRRMSLKAGLPTPRLNYKSELTLLLPVGTDAFLARTKAVFGPWGLQVALDQSRIEIRPMVRTQVILAEVSKNTSDTFGMQWPGVYQAQFLPKFLPPQELMASLQAMETKGLGKILASPTLLCRSGSSAEFQSGGEFAIRTKKFLSNQVIWKKHGVLLKISPIADASGAVSLDIETEISILDKANAVDGIPALKTNHVHSHFDLSQKKTVAISGLVREEWGRSYDGIAGLASLPILGPLFRSESFQKNHSELVIFVTPEVVSTADLGSKIQMPTGWSDDNF